MTMSTLMRVKVFGGAVQEEKPLEGTWKCMYFIAVSNSFNSFIDVINFFKDDFFGENCFQRSKTSCWRDAGGKAT